MTSQGHSRKGPAPGSPPPPWARPLVVVRSRTTVAGRLMRKQVQNSPSSPLLSPQQPPLRSARLEGSHWPTQGTKRRAQAGFPSPPPTPITAPISALPRYSVLAPLCFCQEPACVSSPGRTVLALKRFVIFPPFPRNQLSVPLNCWKNLSWPRAHLFP